MNVPWEALTHWKGEVEVDGVHYDTIDEATKNTGNANVLSVKLLPRQNKVVRPVTRTQDIPEIKTGEIKITVKKYMTEKASEGFDFMEKWNNNNPMPLRTMTGTVLQETRGMVKMALHGTGKAEIYCMRCGRELTNPISRHYGIGPECMSKIGFVGIAIDDIDTIKEKLTNLTWTGWIIKSAITEQEEV